MNAPGMDRGGPVSELESIIAQEVAAAKHMREVLQAEETALRQRDADALGRATADKTGALEALESLESRRRDLCGRIGAGPAPADLVAWLDAHGRQNPAAATPVELWAQLTQLLADCRRLNRANGMAVATLQRRVQQALNLVRTGDSEPAAYGPTGGTLGGPPPRAIARA
jgi:flagellar biosynthesis/type III secretory pathway chaperone